MMRKNQSFQKTVNLFLISIVILFGTVFSFAQSNDCMNRTYTIGGWGAENLNTPQTHYLYQNFDAAFPNDLVIGCASGNTLTLTSAQEVTNFLPSGGTLLL